ncbi:hypothetical protein [Streptomyces sp. NPDC020681]|uniref:hypothetical protein n=1 Tax=Streptomyces sp. NPDC020681 TaxID=3365083 RepID=UPI00378FC560
MARLAVIGVVATGASIAAAGVGQAVTGEDCELILLCPGDPSPTPTPTGDPTPTLSEYPTPRLSEYPGPTLSEAPDPTPTLSEYPTPTVTDDPDPTPTLSEAPDPTPTVTEDPEPTLTTSAPGQRSGANDNDPDGNVGTCTVDLEGAECADISESDGAGSQAAGQGGAKEELAESGAAENTFLIIGGATMIAGGIGFRLLHRLVGDGRSVPSTFGAAAEQ